jgi:hypothetical protein
MLRWLGDFSLALAGFSFHLQDSEMRGNRLQTGGENLSLVFRALREFLG